MNYTVDKIMALADAYRGSERQFREHARADLESALREALDLGEPVAWVDSSHLEEMHAHAKKAGYPMSVIACTSDRGILHYAPLYAKAKP